MMTGKEEYEIDTFEGLTKETREILVEHKLTTLMDLLRFREKWEAMDDLADDQKKMLTEKVKEHQENEKKANQE